MKLKRIPFIAALFGGVAAAQDPAQNPSKPLFQIKDVIDINPDPKVSYWVDGHRIGWMSDGTPLNNQCPVCGTMAPIRHSQPRVHDDAKLFGLVDIPIRCARCNCAFFSSMDKVTTYGDLHEPYLIGTMDEEIRRQKMPAYHHDYGVLDEG